MLPYKNRLHLQRTFKEIFRNGNMKRGEFFLVKSLKNNLPYSRLSIVVSKEIAKKAVKRNSIKRFTSASIESSWDKIDSGFDFVVIYKRNPLQNRMPRKIARQAIEKEVLRVLSEAKLIKK